MVYAIDFVYEKLELHRPTGFAVHVRSLNENPASQRLRGEIRNPSFKLLAAPISQVPATAGGAGRTA